MPVRHSNQLSYEATDVGSWSFVGSNVPAMNVKSLDFTSAIQYMIHFIYHYVHWFIHLGNIWTHKWPAANISGFIAQLVRMSHLYHEVTGSNPVEVLTFFQASLSNRPFRLVHLILFSQYRSCDNTQEVWSFVLFIKMRACKHEYACMHSF